MGKLQYKVRVTALTIPDKGFLSCLSPPSSPSPPLPAVVTHTCWLLSFSPTMLKKIKGKLKSTPQASGSIQSSGPALGLQQASTALNILSNLSATVSFCIPGLKESVDIARQVVVVLQVCGP